MNVHYLISKATDPPLPLGRVPAWVEGLGVRSVSRKYHFEPPMLPMLLMPVQEHLGPPLSGLLCANKAGESRNPIVKYNELHQQRSG